MTSSVRSTPNGTIKNRANHSIIIGFVSGWVGGAVGIMATHPLDSIRVVKQYQARVCKNNVRYHEIIRHIRYVHGVSGFYRGVIPPTVLRGLGVSANRAGYNLGMELFKGEKVHGTWRIWVVGGLAGSCSAVVDMPVQLLKCRAQVRIGLTKETFGLYINMAKRIWKYEGFRAFTNGFTPQLLYNGISFALFYAAYDQFTSCGLSPFVAGMTAGLVSWPPVLPLDSLRVRMQCQPVTVGFTTVVVQMWRQPVRLWFTGLGATMLRAAPRWGITMVAVENCNRILNELYAE